MLWFSERIGKCKISLFISLGTLCSRIYSPTNVCIPTSVDGVSSESSKPRTFKKVLSEPLEKKSYWIKRLKQDTVLHFICFKRHKLDKSGPENFASADSWDRLGPSPIMQNALIRDKGSSWVSPTGPTLQQGCKRKGFKENCRL